MYNVFQLIITIMSKDMCNRIEIFNLIIIFITEKKKYVYMCLYCL